MALLEEKAKVSVIADEIIANYSELINPEIKELLSKVLFCSEYITTTIGRRRDILEELLQQRLIEKKYNRGEHSISLTGRIESVADIEQLKKTLRDYRNREMCRIAWRDIAGFAELEETMLALSELASACIDFALKKLHQWLKEQWGIPRGESGEEQQLVVLGMGKLGACELNYSSDVDLIFCFPEKGNADGVKQKSNDEYFRKLGQQLIAVIDEITADGYVFRVDMRLRPFGSSGPLAMSFSAFEHYYMVQGRSWERYAMIKANVIAGDFEKGEELLQTLKPFVFRKYLDFGAIESLREMKAMVAKEVKRKNLQNNIKLAWGGIREIEFIGQAFQLIRGGREKTLQVRGIQQVLHNLAELNIVDRETADELLQAYRFLRLLENRIQQIRDQQTHNLPDSDIDRERIIVALGYNSWEEFEVELERYREKVHASFDMLIAPEEKSDSKESGCIIELLADSSDSEEVISWLYEVGFKNSKDVYLEIARLRESVSYRALSDDSRIRLSKLMPELLIKIAQSDEADEAVKRIVSLLLKIISRSCYISLLLESEQACKQLVDLCSASSWIANYLSRSPILLDDLLHPQTLYSPLKYHELDRELKSRLRNVAADDLEQQMEVVRQFKQTNTLRVAAADVSNGIDIMKVSDRLSEMAEVILQNVCQIVYDVMVRKHGSPGAELNGKRYSPEFLIVAYGKLGGIELSYSSDLDLVFLHNSVGIKQFTDGEKQLDNATFFARLGQKVIHFLDTIMPAGKLYEVDMRLRPNGNSGLLVSSIEAFEKYQKEKAWTWEHQALVRARAVAGSTELSKQFSQIRARVLSIKRDKKQLEKDIVEMRDKMRAELEKGGIDNFDIKQGRGGVTDIEFIVQYMTLLNACEFHDITQYTDNIRMLEKLAEHNLITQKDRETLESAYKLFRACSHRLAIKEKKAFVEKSQFAELREAVAAVWNKIFTTAS